MPSTPSHIAETPEAAAGGGDLCHTREDGHTSQGGHAYKDDRAEEVDLLPGGPGKQDPGGAGHYAEGGSAVIASVRDTGGVAEEAAMQQEGPGQVRRVHHGVAGLLSVFLRQTWGWCGYSYFGHCEHVIRSTSSASFGKLTV